MRIEPINKPNDAWSVPIAPSEQSRAGVAKPLAHRCVPVVPIKPKQIRVSAKVVGFQQLRWSTNARENVSNFGEATCGLQRRATTTHRTAVEATERIQG